jgi:zinc/manganese transport system substrate-binding protein
MKAVVTALAAELKNNFGLDVNDRAESLGTRLENLDRAIRTELITIPENSRKLVTGHESLGYFARCYDFRLIGAIVPSLTSQAEVSAADIVALKELVAENQVKVVFTELGTPTAVAAAVSREMGVRLIEINTHFLPTDGSYFSLMEALARTIGEALK